MPDMACREGGVIGVPAPQPHPPPQAAEVRFFVDKEFNRLELGTLLKYRGDSLLQQPQ